MKKFKLIAGSFIKGALKSNPLGNAIVTGIQAVRGTDLGTGAPAKPVNWVALVAEIGGVLVLAYLVVKGVIPVEKLIQFLQQFI